MAALGEPVRKRLRAKSSCHVCGGFYRQPVLLRCGSSLCRACAEGLTPAACPDCDAAFDPARLTPNHPLARIVDAARPLLLLHEEEKDDKKEKEEERVFCRQEKALLCQTCYEPAEHSGHEVVPADGAATEYKVRVRNCMNCLRKEEKDFMLHRTTLEVDCEYHIRRATLAWEKMKTEFQQMDLFLKEQKTELLAVVTKLHEDIKRDRKEQLFALSKNLSRFQKVIREVEEASHMPRSGLLENIEGVLQRFDRRETVDPRGSLSLALQNRISEHIDFSMFLQDSMKGFREKVTDELKHCRGIPTPNIDGGDLSATAPEEPVPATPLDQPQPSSPESSGLPPE
ncbi:tripartite motif-containing protein 10-like [Paroedura picta]|uniref:tripartite motif-containing protein 10-like n=1 Tax=Paroedura picta TaxID=143630 RepID=UPI004056A02A